MGQDWWQTFDALFWYAVMALAICGDSVWKWIRAQRNREGLTFEEWQRGTGITRDDTDTRRLWRAGAYPGGLKER